MILGDSRAVGFSYYQFLPENQVLAKNGATIDDIPDYMDQIVALNPSSIFFVTVSMILPTTGGQWTIISWTSIRPSRH